MAAAQVALAVWLCTLVVGDLMVGDPAAPEALARARSRDGAAVVGLFGFVVPVVLGMFPRLAPGLLALERPARPWQVGPPVIGAAMAATSTVWLFTGAGSLLPALPLLAAGGAMALVAGVVVGRRPAAGGLPLARPPADLPVRLLMVSALAYLLVGSCLLLALLVSPDPATGERPETMAIWPLHLLTAGFVVLAVFGVGARMFPAFSGVDAPARALWGVAALGVPAPAGIAVALYGLDLRLLALAGAMALAAAVLFAAVVVRMWVAHKRRRRKAWYLIMAAALTLCAGEAMGIWFALDPAAWALAPVHGEVNTVGFAGLMIFGVLFEFSGGRAARPDAWTAGMALAFAWPAGLALRGLGYFIAAPLVAAVGDLVVAAAFFAAAADAHPRRPRAAAAQPEE